MPNGPISFVLPCASVYAILDFKCIGIISLLLVTICLFYFGLYLYSTEKEEIQKTKFAGPRGWFCYGG